MGTVGSVAGQTAHAVIPRAGSSLSLRGVVLLSGFVGVRDGRAPDAWTNQVTETGGPELVGQPGVTVPFAAERQSP